MTLSIGTRATEATCEYVIVKQSPEGSGEAFEMDTQGADEPLSKPTIANVTIIADKQANDDSFIMQFKKKSGGFFHNVVATVAGDSPNTYASCARITGGAGANVNTALVFNNWIKTVRMMEAVVTWCLLTVRQVPMR